jgi:hypothetical protein
MYGILHVCSFFITKIMLTMKWEANTIHTINKSVKLSLSFSVLHDLTIMDKCCEILTIVLNAVIFG